MKKGFIKRFVARYIGPEHTQASGRDYHLIFDELFNGTAYAVNFYDDLVYHICTNNFTIDPTSYMDLLKNQGFTLDEFFIVMFRLGSVIQAFANYPASYLTHALDNIPDFFSKEQLLVINEAYKSLQEAQGISTKSEETLNPNDWANNIIDKWLKKDKKNVDTKESGRNNTK